MLWLYVVVSILGTILGRLLYLPSCHKDGILKIDTSNPKKDVYRLELDNLYDLKKQKYIVLKIDKNADLSQK